MILCDAILFLRQAKPLGKRLPPKQKSQGNPKCKMYIGKFFETIRLPSEFRISFPQMFDLRIPLYR